MKEVITMKNTKKKPFLFRMATMMMAAFTLAIVMAFPVSASAAEAPATVAVAEVVPLTTMDAPNMPVMQAAAHFAPSIMPLAATDLDNREDGDDQFESVINFFVKWFRRIGAVVALVGAIMFALAIKNNDAEQKQAGLLTLVAGFAAAAICQAVDMFDLFD